MTLVEGDEITIKVVNPYTGNTRRLRAIFQHVREKDGSLEVYDPRTGHIRNYRPEAVVMKHRKKKFGRRI